MNVNLRLIYSICGLALHNLVLSKLPFVLMSFRRHVCISTESTSLSSSHPCNASHYSIAVGALIVLFVKDSERHMWMAFEQMQQYIMYMWIGLFIFCCLVTKNRDYIYQYGLGLIIAGKSRAYQSCSTSFCRSYDRKSNPRLCSSWRIKPVATNLTFQPF